MTIIEILRFFQFHQIELRVEEGRLKFSAAPNLLDDGVLSGLRTHKNEIISMLTRSDMESLLAEADRLQVPPASIKQKIDWMFNQIANARNCPSLNVQFSIYAKKINLDALKQAVAYIVARHEILRTEIRLVEGKLVQKIRDDFLQSIDINVTDLTTTSVTTELSAIVRQEKAKTFDYEKLPLFSMALVKMQDTDCFIFTIDHVCGDEHYFGMLSRELSVAYECFSVGQCPDFKKIPLHYRSYAFWEDNEYNGEKAQEHSEYWKNLLRGYQFPCLTRAFSDYSPPFLFSYKETIAYQVSNLPATMSPYFFAEVAGTLLHVEFQPIPTARYKFHIEFDTYEQLNQQCKRYGCAMSSAIVSFFGIWLHKLTGENRLLMAMLSSGRAHSQFLDVPGCFINDTFFLAEINAATPIFEIVKDAQRQIAESTLHNIYPMPSLLKDFDVSIDALGTVFLNYIAEHSDEELERYEPSHDEGGFPQMDINISIVQYKNSISFDCQYKLSIFEPETIESVMKYFATLLGQLSLDLSLTAADISSPEFNLEASKAT